MIRRDIFKLAVGTLIPFKSNPIVLFKDKPFYKKKPEKRIDIIRAQAKILYDNKQELLNYKLIFVSSDDRYYGPKVKKVEFGDNYIRLTAQDVHIVNQVSLINFEVYSHQDEYRSSGSLSDYICAQLGDIIHFNYTFWF